jgi:hypothetical protein
MFFELRQYRTKPGQREKWVKFMEEEIIPFQVSKGMVILGSFVGQEEDDLYVWIRRFESEAERERLYKAVYESDHWKTYIAPQVKFTCHTSTSYDGFAIRGRDFQQHYARPPGLSPKL